MRDNIAPGQHPSLAITESLPGRLWSCHCKEFQADSQEIYVTELDTKDTARAMASS